MCAFSRDQDLWVSGGVLDGRAWERSVSELLAKGLNKYKRAGAPDNSEEAPVRLPVLIDLGANIGSHVLYAANMGFQSWGVEPLTMNLVKVSINVNLLF